MTTTLSKCYKPTVNRRLNKMLSKPNYGRDTEYLFSLFNEQDNFLLLLNQKVFYELIDILETLYHYGPDDKESLKELEKYLTTCVSNYEKRERLAYISVEEHLNKQSREKHLYLQDYRKKQGYNEEIVYFTLNYLDDIYDYWLYTDGYYAQKKMTYRWLLTLIRNTLYHNPTKKKRQRKKREEND